MNLRGDEPLLERVDGVEGLYKGVMCSNTI